MWLSLLAFSLVWPLMHSYILYNQNIEFYKWQFELAILSSIVALILGGLGFALNISKPGISRILTLTVGNLVLAYGAVFLTEFLLREMFHNKLLITENTQIPYYLPVLIVFVIIQTFSTFVWVNQLMFERNQELKRREDEKELVRQAELSELRQQLQPHFLFNSLNSIQSLLQFDPEAASRMLQTLADFLRGSVNKSNKQLRLFDEEFKHLQLYLDIETIRFEDRLSIVSKIAPETMKATIPALLLQPLIENAIKFGLYGKTGSISISLQAEMRADNLWLKIENPYDTESSSQNKGTGFGLNSVSRRLQLLFYRNDLLKIDRRGDVFSVELIIPQK
jgi:two-component sensor histidine kinase